MGVKVLNRLDPDGTGNCDWCNRPYNFLQNRGHITFEGTVDLCPNCAAKFDKKAFEMDRLFESETFELHKKIDELGIKFQKKLITQIEFDRENKPLQEESRNIIEKLKKKW